MRQNVIIQTLIIAGTLLALLVSIYCFRGAILRSNSPEALKTVIQLFMPPIDLYQPLVSEGMDMSDGFVEKRLSYRHNYMGNHEIGVLLGNAGSELYRINIELLASIVCASSEGIRYTSSMTRGVSFLSKDGGGFGLDTYVVPRDLPLDSEISCTITLSGIDADLIRKYGPARIYIKKTSDM